MEIRNDFYQAVEREVQRIYGSSRHVHIIPTDLQPDASEMDRVLTALRAVPDEAGPDALVAVLGIPEGDTCRRSEQA